MLAAESNSVDASGKSGRAVNAMYATRLMTQIYHLVQPGGQHTLCGLRISRITSERKTNTLQLVHELPNDVTICKHCERIREQDYQGLRT